MNDYIKDIGNAYESQVLRNNNKQINESHLKENTILESDKQPMDGARLLSPNLKPDPAKYRRALLKWSDENVARMRREKEGESTLREEGFNKFQDLYTKLMKR